MILYAAYTGKLALKYSMENYVFALYISFVLLRNKQQKEGLKPVKPCSSSLLRKFNQFLVLLRNMVVLELLAYDNCLVMIQNVGKFMEKIVFYYRV